MSDTPTPEPEIIALTRDEEVIDDGKPDYEEEALNYLKRGLNQKEIADKLVGMGMNRLDATDLTRSLWKGNLDERKTNVRILLGTALFFLILGAAWLIWSISILGRIPALSPSYALFVISAWYFFKAYSDNSNIR